MGANAGTPTYVGLLLHAPGGWPVDAEGFRALAVRCRELARIAGRDDVRQQLGEWVHDFEAEAEAAEKTERYRQAADYAGEP